MNETGAGRTWAHWWNRRGARELSLILWAAWNPVAFGVHDDEFDDFVGPIGSALRDGADVEDVEAVLAQLRRDRLGEDREWRADVDTAELISIWYSDAMSELK